MKVLDVPLEYLLSNVEIDDATQQLIASFATHPTLQELTFSLLQENDKQKREVIRKNYNLFVSKLSQAERKKIKADMDSFNEQLI